MKSNIFYFNVMMRSHSSYVSLVNLLGVKVVRINGSRFWVWDGGECYFIVGSLVTSVLLLPLWVAF
jgi:hypothetical protein